MIGKALSVFDTLIDRLVPDRHAAEQAKAALAEMDKAGELQALLGQLEINRAEAAHKSLFVAGWRPAVGWICATALGYNFVLYPFLQFVVVVSVGAAPADLPVLDAGQLMTLLMGMLGLAGYRTYEKKQGVARE